MTVYANEIESAAALDLILDQTALFNIHREVRGTLLQPRPGQVDKSVRIDRVLLPTTRLLDLGWPHGIIGVEIKKDPHTTPGPAIAQAMDYTRSVFTLAPSGFQVVLGYVFLWPMPKQSGPMASVCAQNRIGSVTATEWEPLQLKSGEQNILRVRRDGQAEIGLTASGNKVGSR